MASAAEEHDKSVIVPLSLKVFRKMVEDSYKANNVPNPDNVREFFEYSRQLSSSGCSEKQWFEGMEQRAANWV